MFNRVLNQYVVVATRLDDGKIPHSCKATVLAETEYFAKKYFLKDCPKFFKDACLSVTKIN